MRLAAGPGRWAARPRPEPLGRTPVPARVALRLGRRADPAPRLRASPRRQVVAGLGLPARGPGSESVRVTVP